MVARAMPMLPRPAGGDPASMLAWANQLLALVEQQIAAMNSPASGGKYTVTGTNMNRTFNASTATAAQVAQAVGTLITDLKTARTID